MPSILIVDDEPGVRSSLSGVLRDEGLDVEAAASGEECLERAARTMFDVIVLDVWLPGVDGIVTLQRLRERKIDSQVVMISGHGNIESAVRAIKMGAFDFVEKPLSLEKTVLVVRNALRQRDLEAENRALRAQLDYPGPLVVDVERFERALTNVALNGIQAMAEGGTLTVASRVADAWVEIRVLDTGRGIPQELQQRVFEPFFTHGEPRGIGLGMAITRRIVEEHGGDVSLTSSAGGGTCVTLRLPLAEARI